MLLRYLADPGFQSGVGEVLGIDQSTVSKTVKDVMEQVMSKANLWIKFHQANEMERAKSQWQRLKKFPNAIGVLDCTHVRISKPREHGDEYIYRKVHPSISA